MLIPGRHLYVPKAEENSKENNQMEQGSWPAGSNSLSNQQQQGSSVSIEEFLELFSSFETRIED